MNKIILFILIAFFVASPDSYAQFSKYIVRLKDKGTNPYSLSNPLQYLTQRSIDRRTRQSIVIDSTDLPDRPFQVPVTKLTGGCGRSVGDAERPRASGAPARPCAPPPTQPALAQHVRSHPLSSPPLSGYVKEKKGH